MHILLISLFLSSDYLFKVVFPQNDYSELIKFNNTVNRFLSEPFTKIMTLGQDCLTKFRVRSFLKNCNSSMKNENYLFDWMQVYNYSLLGEAIRNNLTEVFTRSSLSVKPSGIYNEKFGFNFIHAFQHISGFNFTIENFNRHFDSISNKYKYLTMKSLSGFKMPDKTLYLAYVYGQQHTQLEFENLLNSIKTQRNNNFLLLILVMKKQRHSFYNYSFNTMIGGNLCFFEFEFDSNFSWHSEETTTKWDKILNILSAAAKPKSLFV